MSFFQLDRYQAVSTWTIVCLCMRRAISGVYEGKLKLSNQIRLLDRLRAYLEQILFDCRLR